MAWIIFVGLWVFLSGRKIETVSDKDEFVNVEQAFHTEKKRISAFFGEGGGGGWTERHFSVLYSLEKL